MFRPRRDSTTSRRTDSRLTREDLKELLQEALDAYQASTLQGIQHMFEHAKVGEIFEDKVEPNAIDLDPDLQGIRFSRGSNADGYSRLSHALSHEELPVKKHDTFLRKHAMTSRLDSEDRSEDNQHLMMTIVSSPYFEYAASILVMLNALLIGLEADASARHHGVIDKKQKLLFNVSELAFAMLFTLELLTRIAAHGEVFFRYHNPDWSWNMFDTVVVTCQLVDVFAEMFWSNHSSNLSSLRMIRILRLVRITRIIRTLRLIEELRTLVTSIANSMKSLFWSLILLAIMIYACSVFFTQVVAEAFKDGTPHHAAALTDWFGSLSRTVLTLFEVILGGVSWDEVVRPLIVEVSTSAGILFCLYIAVSVFALMNVVTGVFVEVSTRTAKEEQDENFIAHITEMFLTDNNGRPEAEVAWEEFHEKVTRPEMEAYFRALDVDTTHANELFRLLDNDSSGSVSAGEIIHGLLRLRGHARAKDMGVLSKELRHVNQQLCHQEESIQQCLDALDSLLHKKSTFISPKSATVSAL